MTQHVFPKKHSPPSVPPTRSQTADDKQSPGSVNEETHGINANGFMNRGSTSFPVGPSLSGEKYVFFFKEETSTFHVFCRRLTDSLELAKRRI